MNNKEVVKTIRHIFDQYYFWKDECKADSLIRIDGLFSCEGCIMSSAISTVGVGDNIEDVVCPLVWKRETRVFR